MTDEAESSIASRPWPGGAFESLDRWRQGHVFDGVPMFALGAAGSEPLWASGRSSGFNLAGLPMLVREPSDAGRAMVLSQGCDLIKERFPFATVAPVYDAASILSEHQQQSARAGGTWHLVHLTSDWAVNGFWVADLRLETSIDKAILLSAEPLDAFNNEIGYAKLAERLAAGRLRPAVPQPVLDHVVAPLKEHLAGRASEGAEPLAGVREVRVQSNHATAPTSATLFVVSNEGEQPDREEWDAAFGVVHEAAAAHGIALMGPEIASLWDMSAADYLTSHAVDNADSS